MKMLHAQPVFEASCEVGESPSWDPRTGRLMWVDILKGTVFSGNPATGVFEVFHQADCPIGAVRPAVRGAEPGFVLAEQGRLTLLDAGGVVAGRLAVGPQESDLRANDAEPDPSGRLVVGTMDFDGAAGRGSLVSIEPDGSESTVMGDLAVPNGMAWSVGGTQLYFVDSARRTVDLYEYDPTIGAIGSGRTYCDLSDVDGVPDGIALDEAGFLYVAIFDGGSLLVIDPEGRIVSTIAVAARQVTSCAFGDADGQTLYITTASYEFGPTDLEEQPLAGSVFSVKLEARGAQRHKYMAMWGAGR